MGTVTRTEHALAEISICILRDNGVTDEEILSDYTSVRPLADRAYERLYRQETGIVIAAEHVKSKMIEMLTH